MPSEIEEILNKASGNLEFSDYRNLLTEIKSDIEDRLLALEQDEINDNL